MYSSFHSAVAIGILLSPLPLPVKVPLAICSHAVVDMLGEASMPYAWWKEEFPLYVILGIVTLAISPYNMFTVIFGIICGNLFDILDMRYEHGKWEKVDIIHQQNRFGKWFYPPVKINLSYYNTVLFNMTAMSIASILVTQL